MGNARHIKVAIQDQPARFSNLTVNGTATFNSTVILDGTVTGSAIPDISPYQGVAGGSILPYGGNNSINGSAKNSSILAGKNNDISAGTDNGAIIGGTANLLEHDNSFIIGAGITSSAVNTTFANSMSLDGILSIPGFPDVSASLAAGGGGGGTPTLQQVTDQGSSTTTPITASIISASGDIISSKLEITNTSLDDSLLITTTENSSTAGPVFTFKRNSSSPDNGDYLGQIKFKGENDANQEVIYAKITGKISDVTDTTEDGIIEFATKKAGSNVINARLTSTNLKLINSTGLEVNGDISTDGNVSSSGDVFGVTGSFSHLEGNSPITVGDPITFQQPITASSDMTSSANIYVGKTNISNPRGDGFMAGNPTYSNRDIVFLTHQDFHLVDLATAGSPLDNIAGQRTPTITSNTQVNGGATDHRFASYIIPCGFKIIKVGVLGNSGTFNVRATSIASGDTQDCFAEGGAQSITTSAPADTFAGYLGMASDLGGEAAIIPSASIAGGLGNYINIDIIGNGTVYGGVIVLERI